MPTANLRLPAVEIRNLSKVFRHSRSAGHSFKEMALNTLTLRRRADEDVVALQDINLTIQPGESVGFIGRNGSGKTTLLKLIAGTTRQSGGTLITRGRVGALTDLWAGFHEDLSGMENIFLSAALYNLPRREVFDRLDAIQEFAGLDEFIFTPVKSYSSGMLIRLVFSILAHFEPEILLLDEILACGDSRFQKKAAQRILELKQCGVTIIFVTHYVELMERIVDRVVWLQQGRIERDGETRAVLSAWFGGDREMFTQPPAEPFDIRRSALSGTRRFGTGEVLIESVRLLNAAGAETQRFQEDEPIVVEVALNAIETSDVELFLAFFRVDDSFIGLTARSSKMGLTLTRQRGAATLRMELRPVLYEGCYDMTVYLAPPAVREQNIYDLWLRFRKIMIVPHDVRGLKPVLKMPAKISWHPAADSGQLTVDSG